MYQIPAHINSCVYPIYIGRDVLANLSAILRKFRVNGPVLIVSQSRIWKLHGGKLRKGLAHARIHVVPEGEQAKSEKELFRLYEAMLKARLDRSSHVIAVGGGVVGDLTGYAASTFKRGIGLIHVPTTLLAQVDSSIGGKTAINLKAGKNLVGTFYQPKAVLSDVGLLRTLPREVISDSLAEVIKYGVMSGNPFFGWLERNIHHALKKDIGILEKIVLESARSKVRVVQSDPYETRGYRELLNYGHTFGHAIEARGGYQHLTHGKAVAVGMMAAGELAYRMGFIRRRDLDHQRRLIESAELPTSLKGLGFKPREIYRYFLVDKKVREGQIKFILPQGIGKLLVVKGIPPSLIEETLKQIL